MDPSAFLHVLRLIERIPLEYMVAGSVAAILYGKPRLTHDMDLVMVFPVEKIAAFRGLFDTEAFYCPPPETIAREVSRSSGGHFNLIDNRTGFKIDCYLSQVDSLARWGFSRKRRIEIVPGEAAWVAPAEYVILHKLLFFREGGSRKHLYDIRGIMDVSGADIDRSSIDAWVQRLGLDTEWKSLWGSGPDS